MFGVILDIVAIIPFKNNSCHCQTDCICLSIHCQDGQPASQAIGDCQIVGKEIFWRHRMTRHLKIWGLVFFVLILACAPKPHDTLTLHAALRTDPPTLDPNLATDNVSLQVLIQTGEGLTQFDEKLRVLPANARSWDVSADGLVYTFHLDAKYMWSDDTPVLAQHFLNSWLRLLHPKTASPYAYFLYAVSGAQAFNEGKIQDPTLVGLRVVNDLTFEVTLDKPLVYFPMITTFMVTFPIRTDVLKEDPDYFSHASRIISNGAYRVVEWKHDDKVILEKNPYYGGSPVPQVNRVVLSIVPEAIIELALYLRGDLDYAMLTPMAIAKYEGRPDHVSFHKLRGYYYGFNQKLPPFDKIQWRQALAMSLDKTKIPKILRGHEEPTDSWVPPGMFGFNKTIGLKFNPTEARKLIADDLSSGKISPIELHFNSDLINQKIAEWAQNEWRVNLGIDVKLINEEWASYINRLNTDPPALFRLGWGADYPDPDNFMALFTSISGNNHTGWANPSYDELIEKARVMTDSVARKRTYDKAQRILLEENTVILPLFVQTTHFLVSPKISHLPLIPLDYIPFKSVRLR